MKKFLAICICWTIILINSMPVYATENSHNLLSYETDFGNGITSVSEIIVEATQTRSTDKTATRRETFYYNDDVIAVIAFQATYRYDGSTVSVVSKSVTQTDTYSGWGFTQNSFSSTAGTVTLEGKLVRWLLFNPTTITMNMTCDKNGNISF